MGNFIVISPNVVSAAPLMPVTSERFGFHSRARLTCFAMST